MILVCGEALIDLFVTPDAVGEPMLKPVVGGSSFNLAIGLARLKTPTAFLGGVSVDYFGTVLAGTLQKEEVDTSVLKRTERPTPLVLVSPDADGHPSYMFYANESAAQDVLLADVPQPLPPSLDAIALGSRNWKSCR